MPSDLNDDRWHDLLKLMGELRQDMQVFKDELRAEQAERLRSLTIAFRTLVDWWVKDTDEERATRAERQAALDARLEAIRRSQRYRTWIEAAVAVALLVAIVVVLVEIY